MTKTERRHYMKEYRRKLRRRMRCIDCGKNPVRIIPEARRKPVLCEACRKSRLDRFHARKALTL